MRISDWSSDVCSSDLRWAAFRSPLLRETPLWRRARQYIARSEAPLPERLETYNFYQPGRLAEVFDADALGALDLDAPWREMREIYPSAGSGEPPQRRMPLAPKQALAAADPTKGTA